MEREGQVVHKADFTSRIASLPPAPQIGSILCPWDMYRVNVVLVMLYSVPFVPNCGAIKPSNCNCYNTCKESVLEDISPTYFSNQTKLAHFALRVTYNTNAGPNRDHVKRLVGHVCRNIIFRQRNNYLSFELSNCEVSIEEKCGEHTRWHSSSNKSFR